MQRRLSRGPYGSRVIHVLSQIRSEVDPGNYQVRPFRQQLVQRHDHAIRRRPIHRPLPLRHVVANDRLPQRQRLRRSALFLARRHDAHGRESLQYLSERPQTLCLNTVVVCQKNMSHSPCNLTSSPHLDLSREPICSARIEFPRLRAGANSLVPAFGASTS